MNYWNGKCFYWYLIPFTFVHVLVYKSQYEGRNRAPRLMINIKQPTNESRLRKIF